MSPSISPDDLIRGMEQEEFWPALQPIVDLRTKRIMSFEMLARWTSRQHGEVSPGVFIPLAESAGLLTRLLGSLLPKVAPHMTEWPSHIKLAVNVSPTQIATRQRFEQLRDVLSATHRSAARIQIELTEECMCNDPAVVRIHAKELKALGYTFSLDDFGTGFSGLSRLNTLPFDEIKIDASFISQIETNPKSLPLVRWMIALGSGLGMDGVAEGIETQAQLDLLLRTGCRLGQGYLFGRPIPAHCCLALLSTQTWSMARPSQSHLANVPPHHPVSRDMGRCHVA